MKNMDGLQSWGWRPMPPVGGVPANIFPTEDERRAAADRVRAKRAIRVLLRNLEEER